MQVWGNCIAVVLISAPGPDVAVKLRPVPLTVRRPADVVQVSTHTALQFKPAWHEASGYVANSLYRAMGEGWRMRG